MVSAVASGVVGCGGTSTRKQTTGKAGADGGTAGGNAGGTAGGAAGAAGDSSMAGAMAGVGGMAGDTTDAGGMAGAAGMAGAGGMAGGAGTAPVQTYCEMHPEQVRALPYTIAKDFTVVHVLTNNGSAGYWKVLGTPDCSDNPTYPSFTTADGGTDAGDDGGTDAGVDGGTTDASVDGGDDTLALTDLDAGDAGVDAGAADTPVDVPVDAPALDGSGIDVAADVPVDAAVDVALNDGGADAGPPLPACYEFSYDPDGCVNNCWAGVVFQVTDVQGPSADTQGVCIAPGAMNVEFWARSSKNGARVKFGSIGEGTNSTEFYLNITNTWARYTVSIPGTYQQGNYNTTSGNMQGVWNAFSVVVEPQDYVGGAYIEVKDIHWIATQ
jgi:hypothetical protein